MNGKWLVHTVFVCGLAWCAQLACAQQVCEFNDYSDGLVEGQKGWNVWNKVPDPSAFSIVNGLGATGQAGDRAMVIQPSQIPLKVVGPEPVRWMPGEACELEFYFKVGVVPGEFAYDKRVMTVLLGNALMTEKACWEVHLLVAPDGSWKLSGGMPGESEAGGVSPDAILDRRKVQGVAVSNWFRFKLVAKKLTDPDTFATRVEVYDLNSKLITSLEFPKTAEKAKTAGMWNLSRVSYGFLSANHYHGLSCIDNVKFSSYSIANP